MNIEKNEIDLGFKKETDFKLTFRGGNIEKTVHVPFNEVPNFADILSEFMKSKGINCYVTTKEHDSID